MRSTGADGHPIAPSAHDGSRPDASPADVSQSGAIQSGAATQNGIAQSGADPGAAAGGAAAGGAAGAARRDSARVRGGWAPRGLPARLALPLALVGGLALYGAFPPAGIWPLAAVGPALLAVALWGRSLRGSALTGLVFGVAFFVPLLSWVINVAWYAWVALALADAIIFAVLAMGQRLLLRLPGWPVAVAGWWVAAEAVRDRWPWGGFPWGRLAMSQAGAPTLRWVAIGNPPLLTFLLALAGGTLAWLLLGRSASGRARSAPADGTGPDGTDTETERGGLRTAGQAGSGAGGSGAGGAVRRRVVPGLAFAAAAGLTLAGALLPVNRAAAGTPTTTVAAVQGNVPHSQDLQGLVRATTVTANHAVATEQLAQQVKAGTRAAPAVVIWPENSTDIDPGRDPVTFATISSAVQAINRPVLVGAVLQGPVRNSGQLWEPGRGPVAVYIKRQLVPFGEVIPLRGLLSKITSLTSLQPVNFTPGHKAVVFRIGKIRLGDVICYEIGFDNLVGSEVSAGANLLVEQTNDATFEVDGQAGETLQQLDMARVRAVETNRSVVVASTTGVSAIITPDGHFLARSGIWQRAVLEARVPLRTARTLASRVGDGPELVLTGLTIAALLWALPLEVAARRRGRRAS